jgi:hypothetical protein
VALAQMMRNLAFKRGVWLVTAAKPSDTQRLMRQMKPRSVPLRRFGPAGDGGYLMPDDLEGVVGCISPGVSTECGFDLDMARRGIEVFMADASVERAPIEHPKFHFEKVFLDTYDSDSTRTIDDFCRKCPTGDLILQMDIEGAEYRVIENMSETLLKRFRIAVIEFHYLHQLFDSLCIDRVATVFAKLRRHHDVVHIHPNNHYSAVTVGGLTTAPIMEFTFYRRDRMQGQDFSAPQNYPNPLDADNVPGRPPIVLPHCWQ